ncbi:MAG: methyltransferase domain-containing protein [Actinomycetota bacterium]|nr:methyltransferase domain-containing protein [Actinomycetota bacterium]MDA3028459.1 methyltransferase domain-containing protein [Actinomycetota bacterium]
MTSELDLLIDLHIDAERQGPGGDDVTRLAVALAGLGALSGLEIADIGCGTGASTLVLAEHLDARVTAVDFLPAFLERLGLEARQRGLADRITTLAVPMDELGFEPESLDVIWSEGAIYNMGFAAGIRKWREFLKPGGVLAVSEITWLTDERPAELEAHWAEEYPEIATASAKIAILESTGYSLISYFPLPSGCWLDHYYRPMRERFPSFLERHGHSAEARAIVDAERHEMDLYERYSSFVSYGFYIATRTDD